jgi:type III secretory pathway component EscV
MLAKAATVSPESGNVLGGSGTFLLVVGFLMFSIAVLVELFSIGTYVRRIASILAREGPDALTPRTQAKE